MSPGNSSTTAVRSSREEISDVDSLLPECPDNDASRKVCRQRMTSIQKLGRIQLAIFCFAPLLAAVAIGFLVFLWIPSSRISWRAIATTAWLPRSVTLCALAIRVAVDLLTVLSTSMIAALVLETESVHLGALASISIMRAAAPSPWNLAWDIVRNRSRLSTSLALALLLSGLTVSLQFSSTILLSDFREGEIMGLPNTTSYFYDLD
ncbi:hypothetical protein F4677DRAFT_443615 [Hypoxylon crocopeplum]|nr:hypothetical protein F4677DRAFT_443615 [Hypoxylon crocopeplum]